MQNFKIICMSCYSEDVELYCGYLVCEECGVTSLDSPPRHSKEERISITLSDPHPNGTQDCYLRGINEYGKEVGKKAYIGVYDPDKWDNLEEFANWMTTSRGFESTHDLWKSMQDHS